ncbi:hypothetical protein D3C72_1590340 [compost metagenome]
MGHGHELARDQARIFQPVAAADREVVALADQVDAGVLQVQLQPQVRVARHEGGDVRRDAGQREGQRRAHAQHAARARAHGRQRGVGLVQVVEDAREPLHVGRAGLGEAHAARGAVDQPHLQVRLQLGDVLADGRRRQPQLPRGAGEAARRGGGAKDLEGGEMVHGPALD